MPGFIEPSLRLVASGHIGTAQTWSTSLWIASGITGITPTQAELDAVRTQMQTATNTWATAMAGNLWSADTQYDGIKLYYYPIGSTHSSLVSQNPITPNTGSLTVYKPSYMSCVVSLRSDTPGRSGRGRNYVPATAVTLSSSHKFTSTVLSFVGAGHRAWLQSLNALVYAGPGLSNQKVQVASFSKGAMRTVTAITIDDNPDTQHRRSDKIGNQILYTATI